MDALKLDRVAFYGRTLAEYQRIFDIDFSEWKGRRVLDCPAGASSFMAEATAMGIGAMGCDPLFGQDFKTLAARGEADIAHVIERASDVPHLYKWDFYPSIEALKEYRTRALRGFEADYQAGLLAGRYVKAALPLLPFSDGHFDLAER